jgi:hypothetical protein
MTNEQKITRLMITKLSLDDDYSNGLIDSFKYQQLVNSIDSAIESLLAL